MNLFEFAWIDHMRNPGLPSKHQKRQSYYFMEYISWVRSAFHKIQLTFHLVYHILALMVMHSPILTFYQTMLYHVHLFELTRGHRNPIHTMVWFLWSLQYHFWWINFFFQLWSFQWLVSHGLSRTVCYLRWTTYRWWWSLKVVFRLLLMLHLICL